MIPYWVYWNLIKSQKRYTYPERFWDKKVYWYAYNELYELPKYYENQNKHNYHDT